MLFTLYTVLISSQWVLRELKLAALATSLVLLPKVDENTSLDNKPAKERIIEILDLLESHVEKLRKEATQLEEDRDQLLTTLDSIRHADLMNQLDDSKFKKKNKSKGGS